MQPINSVPCFVVDIKKRIVTKRMQSPYYCHQRTRCGAFKYTRPPHKRPTPHSICTQPQPLQPLQRHRFCVALFAKETRKHKKNTTTHETHGSPLKQRGRNNMHFGCGAARTIKQYIECPRVAVQRRGKYRATANSGHKTNMPTKNEQTTTKKQRLAIRSF